MTELNAETDSFIDIEDQSPADEAPDRSTVAVNWKDLLKQDGSGDEARRRVFAFSASRNKSTYRKVEEAIAVIGTSETGASIPAILMWIINNHPTLDQNKLKVNVKRAVLKGLKIGRLVRTRNSKKALGVAGSFTFPAQRIKLKAVRLEGRKYVFPILQPLSSSSSADQVKGKVDEAVSSPKRVKLNASKLDLDEDSNVTDEADQVYQRKTGKGVMSSPKVLTPKRKKLNASKLAIDEHLNGTDEADQVQRKTGKGVMSSPKVLTPKRVKLNRSNLTLDEDSNGTDETDQVQRKGVMSSPKVLTPKRVKQNRSKLVLKEASELNAEQVTQDDKDTADSLEMTVGEASDVNDKVVT